MSFEYCIGKKCAEREHSLMLTEIINVQEIHSNMFNNDECMIECFC